MPSESVRLENRYPTIASIVHRRADGQHVAYLPSDHVSSWGNWRQPEGVECCYQCTSPVVAMYLDLDQAHGHRINTPKRLNYSPDFLSTAISPLMPRLPRFPSTPHTTSIVIYGLTAALLSEPYPVPWVITNRNSERP